MTSINSQPTHLFDGTKFQWWLLSRFLTNFARQMLALVISWQVYEISKSPLALGGIGLSEAIPFFAVALWAGHMADTRERRSLLIGSVWAQAVCALVLYGTSIFGPPPLVVIYSMIGVAGMATGFEVAGAGSYVQTLIPTHLFPKAAAWNLTLFNGATIVGPIIGGWLISFKSASFAYGITAVLFSSAALATLILPKIYPSLVHHESDDSGMKRILTGLKFIKSERLVLASMTLDMVAVLFGGAVAIFPMFAELLKVGPTGLGMLRSAQAVGSFGIALTQTRFDFIKPTWKNLCRSVVIFGIATIGFALSKNFPLTLLLLTVSGMADGISVIVRSSLLQARTPDHLRGRVVAVGSMFIRSSNEIGGFESGVAAQLMGTVPSVVFGGAMTLISVVALRAIFPDLEKKPA